MNPNSHHLFKNHRGHYLYLRSHQACLKISETLYEELRLHPERIDFLRAAPQHPVEDPSSTRTTVYFNISSSCNLQCSYCYANRGGYQSSQKPMSRETLRSTLDYFLAKGRPISHYTFFGGEPLLRLAFMRESVSMIRAFALQNAWPAPHFSIVTNGVLLDEQSISFLRQEGFHVTVSMDGPKEIHDALRPDALQRGTFDRIEVHLRSLIAHGIRPFIEVTYTQLHRDHGITPLEILRFFHLEYGIESILIAPAGGDDSSPWKVSGDEIAESFSEAATYALASLESEHPIQLMNVMSILKNLRTPRKSHQYCYANLGENHYAISTSGEIYPCQMFNEQEPFKMGSVFAPTETEPAEGVRSVLQSRAKDRGACASCWAKDLCTLCLGGVQLETGQIETIPEHRCTLVRKLSEVSLAHSAEKRS